MVQSHEISNNASTTNSKEQIDPDNVDAMLAAELNAMSFQERQKIYEELHGVDDVIQETPELVTTALKEMDLALQQIPNNYIYDQAKRINSYYVEDPSFRRMFLRSEYFNPERAATRLIKFLENKVKYFGDETLARPIYLTDLNHDDIQFLKSGILQSIPARDQSGREVLCDFNMDPTLEQPKAVINYIKVLVYLALAAAEDDETQIRGIVGVYYFTNVLPLIPKFHESKPNLFDWLPIKLVGLHVCQRDARLRIISTALLLFAGKKRRVRVRMHEGSHTECQYKLMTFGVPVSHFPVSYEGHLKTTVHAKWLARRVVKETALQSVGTFQGIYLPHSHDVLFGRGKILQDHSGNVMLRRLIAEHMPEYRNVPKKEKANVGWKVMMATKMHGGRFLKREPDGWWVEVSDEVAREKISMTFRTSRSLSEPPLSDTISVQAVHRAYHEIVKSDTLEPTVKRLKTSREWEPTGVVDYSSNSGFSSTCIHRCPGLFEC